MRTRDIIGKRIVAVRLNRFNTGRSTGNGGKAWSFDPTFVLDDGTAVSFVVDETEVGEYGIHIVVSRPARTARRIQ